jgi:hypothetical protein
MEQSTAPRPPTAGIELPATLEDAQITCLPATAFYIPNFITEDEEQQILDKVGTAHTKGAIAPFYFPFSPNTLNKADVNRVSRAIQT